LGYWCWKQALRQEWELLLQVLRQAQVLREPPRALALDCGSL